MHASAAAAAHFHIFFSRVASTTATGKMSVRVVRGNLLEASEIVVAHQCNCTTTSSAGLAAALFAKYPAASYAQCGKREPGHVRFFQHDSDHTIVNLYAQQGPGGPTPPGGGRHQQDTIANRFKWFETCMAELARYLRAHGHRNVALPYLIGCGLARGRWSKYSLFIQEWAGANHIDVVLYQKKC